jgi:hypothetical protein
VERESSFNILKNGGGHLMFLIRARMGGVRTPYIVYDGGENAVLYRDKKNPVLLNYIHPAIRSDLKEQKGVLVVETNDGAIIREYNSPVKVVKALPVLE